VQDIHGLPRACGYEAWISVEWEERWHPEMEEPEVALPRHLSVLRTWLARLEAGA
jgi:hypothetical protein